MDNWLFSDNFFSSGLKRILMKIPSKKGKLPKAQALTVS